jgi:hypothetical protein
VTITATVRNNSNVIRELRDDNSDGERSVTAGVGGVWTSDPIAVTPGKTYGASVVARGGGVLSLEQLSATGLVLSTVQNATSVQIAGDVTAVRIKLAGGLVGTATFDDVVALGGVARSGAGPRAPPHRPS